MTAHDERPYPPIYHEEFNGMTEGAALYPRQQIWIKRGDYDELLSDFQALRAEVERLRAKADEHRDGRLAALEQATAAEARVSRVEELAASLTYPGKWANADDEDQTKHVCAELIRAAINDQG